jgi:MFS family permease
MSPKKDLQKGLAKLRQPLGAFGGVFANRNLRRLELGWMGSIIGEWAYAVALSVYAYHHGGATAVGLLMLARMLSAALAAPLMSVLGDRHRRELVMVLTDLTRAGALAGAGALTLMHAPPLVVYALAVFVAIVSTAFRPAQAALTPSLAQTPEQLTAANAVASTIESVGMFAGPAIGGLLLAATSIGVVLLATAGTFLWSALLVAQIRGGARPVPAQDRGHETFSRQATAGIRAIVGEPNVRVIVGLYGCQTLVSGTLRVFIVVMAFQLLDTGNAGVGFLNSAIGVGGLVGALATIVLIGRSRLATDFGVGVVLWGAPIALAGVWPNQALALILLGVVGLANTVVDVATFTLLQRAVPDHVLARVFGVLQSVLLGTTGLGSVIAAALVSGLGARAALIAAGAFLPVVAILTYPRLRAIDEAAAPPPADRAQLLRDIPIFAPLSPPILEHLVGRLSPASARAGDEIVREGEPGDRFYIVSSGEVEVHVNGRPVRREGRGGYFGEIALLRDVPRTATVSAHTDVELFALDRDDFLPAVTGHADSAEAADAVVGSRLGISTV